jgi:outer membrane lipoprotein-sorting protein
LDGLRISIKESLVMRPIHVLVLIGTTLLPVVPGFGAPPADDPLAAALARMDRTTATFKGLKADMKKVAHLDAINKDETDIGTITVKRGAKPKDLQMLVDFKQPDAKQFLVSGSKAWSYILKNPNEVQEYDLSRKFRGMLDQYLLLGFGSYSRDLRDAYTVTLGKPPSETVEGEKTTKIELIPKSAEMLAQVKRCELWISDSKGITVQQKLHTGGGDYHLVTYTNMVVNPPIGDLKLDTPRGVKTTRPLKD